MAAQIIGVGAAVVGDMSSRPYWGLYELDFVFSTLVVSAPFRCIIWRQQLTPHSVNVLPRVTHPLSSIIKVKTICTCEAA